MQRFDYTLKPDLPPRLGLVALQTDERIEQDFRRLIPEHADLFVTRVPSGLDVTPGTLAAMEAQIPAAAALLPQSRSFDAIGYGCTSGTAQIGPDRVAEQVRAGAATHGVSDPLSALVAACRVLGLTRLAFLSPYVETVSDRLRAVLGEHGVATPVFGTFAEAEEARVARIAPAAIADAASRLAASGGVDGVFLSCTNLDTLGIIAPLENATGLPILSSNQVLAWHLCTLAGLGVADTPATARLSRACRAAA